MRKGKIARPNGGTVAFSSGLIKRATKHVESLQKRLFQAISEGKLRKQIRYGWLLKNSYYNKILAVWKVAHINTGKKTAGIDGMKIKLSDTRSISKIMDKLTGDLRDEKWQPMPARRVMIPKPDGTERPLGIPTQYDRVVQYILNSILDVTVEHQIYSHKCGTYGFRKYHSSADAIGNLTCYARIGKHAIAIEADISKCFDKINHQYILELVKNIPAIRNEVERLLKAGYMHNECRYETTEGTPQGGVISPTLSNLVLRNVLDIPMAKTPKGYFGKNIANITLTTYADDLVIIISPRQLNKNNHNQWQTEVSQNVLNWLKPQLSIAGLELKESKTRIITDDTPFDFLGYEIQRGKGIRLKQGMVKKLRKSVKSKLRRGRGQQRVWKEINPILRGVYNYAAKFSSGKMWKQLNQIDFDIENRLHKLYKTYDIGQVKFTDVPKTTDYIPVKKGITWLVNKEYWDKRNLSMLSPRKKALHKKQNGICPHCQRNFTLKAEEVLETHHLKAKGKGGKDTNQNVNLYHAQCHKEIHQQERISEFERTTNLKWRAYDGIITPP
jgi:RNA-directed DNA polymerase